MTYRKVGGIHFLSSRFFTLSFSMRSNRPCLIKFVPAFLTSRLKSLREPSYPKAIITAIVVPVALLLFSLIIAETQSERVVHSAPLGSILDYLVSGFL